MLWSLQLNVGQIIADPLASRFAVIASTSVSKKHDGRARRRPAFLHFNSSSPVPTSVSMLRASIVGGVFAPASQKSSRFMFLTGDLELCSDEVGVAPAPAAPAVIDEANNFQRLFAAVVATDIVETRPAADGALAKAASVFRQATHVAPPVDRLLADLLAALLPPREARSAPQTQAQPMDQTGSDAVPAESPTLVEALAAHSLTLVADGASAWDGSSLFTFTPTPMSPAPSSTPARTPRRKGA